MDGPAPSDTALPAELALGPRAGGDGAPVHLATVLGHLVGEPFEVDVEMSERMVLDRLSGVAQRVEFRHPLDGGAALDWEALLEPAEGLLKFRVVNGLVGVGDETAGG